MATMQADDDDDQEAGGGMANILSGVGLIAALVVLVFQLMTASTWIGAPDSKSPGDWMQLME